MTLVGTGGNGSELKLERLGDLGGEEVGEKDRILVVVFVVLDASEERRRRVVGVSFRRCSSNFGSSLRNDGWAYMAVSGPFRAFVKPY